MSALAQRPTTPIAVGNVRQESRTFFSAEDGLPSNDVRAVIVEGNGSVCVRTAQGDSVLKAGKWVASTGSAGLDGELMVPESVTEEFKKRIREAGKLLSVSHGAGGQTAIGTEEGLFVFDKRESRQVFPAEGNKRWAPTHVTVDHDETGRLWFASRQGVGCLANGKWKLFTGSEGLPYDDLTAVACGRNGEVWFGSRIGVIRYDGERWAYRQGRRWLPNDDVRDIAIDSSGNAWIATAGGVSFIHFTEMNLADKAKFYEDQIDRHHRRTEFGYVDKAVGGVPGSKQDLQLSDSDNDGLWTSMYGAGECFAYGATNDPAARRRAQNAFRALRFLSEVCQGSPHEPPSGFIARTILETALGEDPNASRYSLKSQRRRRRREDGAWRVYEPRWPKSADGKYYWKSDTSSDELDGHYFFYALYYDLVADTAEEKSLVRKVVKANIDHLIEHDFSLHDHAGRTRWAVYGPKDINQDPDWHAERGINSISMLSYLNVAHHLTGDSRYRDIAKDLRDKHSYHINALRPKYQRGIGSGNHSDDEMAFMAYYNLIKYEPNESLKSLYLTSFANSWRLEEPEMNPFFNFCFAAHATNAEHTTIWGTYDLSPWPSCLVDAVETLKRFPLDRFNWRHENSHRKDLIRLTDHFADVYEGQLRGRGYRNNGKVIPVDERSFNHWNMNPWRLNSGGSGNVLGTGTVFTLPYYMGLYHGFIAAD